MTKPTLTYFAVRGRAELIRLVLAEAGVEYQEHPVGKDTTPVNGRPTDFAALKKSGLLAYEQVPVWEDADGFRLAQSRAIATYLARQHGLYGKDAREAARCDEIVDGIEDLRNEVRKVIAATPEQRPAIRADLIATIIPRWLGFFNALLIANNGGNGFLAGDKLSLADLALWYALEMIQDNHLGAGMEKFPKLREHFDRVAKTPRIAAYLASPKRPALTLFPS